MTKASWKLLSTICIIFGCHGDNLRSQNDNNPCTGLSSESHVYKESIPQLSIRNDLKKRERIRLDHVHEVMFVIRQKNMDELTRVLNDLSDPLSSNYGQHWTSEQVANLTSNPEARDFTISYIQSRGASVVSESLYGEHITAEAPIRVWEKIFNTQFFEFEQTHQNKRIYKSIRAEHYWIPSELDVHVESVLKTIDLPDMSYRNPMKNLPVTEKDINLESGKFSLTDWTEPGDFLNLITPRQIRAYYNMSFTKTGSAKSTQAIMGTLGFHFGPLDLEKFQTRLIPIGVMPVTADVGGRANDSMCKMPWSYCIECNRDLQCIMGTSPKSPTTFWYTDDGFHGFLSEVANSANPPKVISISYGTLELYVTASIHDSFTTWAIKLGTMGTTIVASSGDAGAVWYTACGYNPQFPSSSPYVTAVGATSGVEYNLPETVVMASDAGWSSGGGFSTYYPVPDFQKKHIKAYFSKVNNTSKAPVAGYGSGRGFPDISLTGRRIVISVGDQFSKLGGTSASAPLVAGFFSNINAARMAIGKGSLGWVNPALYATSASFTNDVTDGSNFCPSKRLCCAEGFHAGPGWDPASGLGSVNYGKMEAALKSLGSTVNGMLYGPTFGPTPIPIPSAIPTTSPPTASPSIAPSMPTYRPTTAPPMKKPSSKATADPTSLPSIKPTYTIPTAIPSMLPTSAPSITPTMSPSMTPSATPTGMPSRTSSSTPSVNSPSPLLISKTYQPNSSSSISPTSFLSPAVSSIPTNAVPEGILSIIKVWKTFGGVSLSQTSNAQFTEAIVESVSETLKLPIEAVRGISLVENRRMLLSSVTVSYTLHIISGMTSDYFVNELQTSITNGKFLTILSTKSTIQISSVYDLRFMDYSPTASPTSLPLQSLSKSGPNLTIAAAVGGGLGGIISLVAIIAFICFCGGCRRGTMCGSSQRKKTRVVLIGSV